MRQGRVELRVLERQPLGGRTPHVDARMTVLHRGDERLRWIDGRNGCRTESFDQFGGQCTRAASDVEHSLTRRELCEIGELRRKQ